MKVAYIGIDLLYPALAALRETGAEILKIFTCETDNRTEFNTEICRDAETHGTPLQRTRIWEADLIALREAGCEMVLCGGYYYKIPIVEGMKMINIHPALLPIGRGGVADGGHDSEGTPGIRGHDPQDDGGAGCGGHIAAGED